MAPDETQDDAQDTVDVFISYKREERGMAEQLGRALKNAGFSYISDIGLDDDAHFADAVDKRLRRARLILVLWTKAAALSNWVRLEARFGYQKGIYLGVEVEPLGDLLPVDLAGVNRAVVAQGRGLNSLLPEIVTEVQRRLCQRSTTILAASAEDLDFTADNMAFETAAKVDTKDAYAQYLARFPNGFMAKEARARQARLGTLGYWLARNKGYVAGLITAVAALGVFGLEAMKETATRGDLTRAEERALKAQADKVPGLETQVAGLQDRPTASEMAAALEALQAENDAKMAALQEDHAEALRAAVREARAQVKKASVATAPPPFDCRENGVDGYDLPKHGGNGRQCAMPDVTRLDLWKSGITTAEMQKLAGLIGLQTLSLLNTQVSDVTPLAGLTGLQWLSLGNTQVSDVTPLSGLTRLQTLSLSDTQVSDVTPLAGLTGLQKLSLLNTQVSDVTPLADLTGLRWLDLSDTQMSDVTPLSGLTGLHYFAAPKGKSVGDRFNNTPEARAAVADYIAEHSN